MMLKVACRWCGRKYTLAVDRHAYKAWAAGKGLAQELMPSLLPEERELLISGTCPKCWEELFSLSDEE